MRWEDHLTINPDINQGKLTVMGARLSVQHILDRKADGWSDEELYENYPGLTVESLKAVYVFVNKELSRQINSFRSITA